MQVKDFLLYIKKYCIFAESNKKMESVIKFAEIETQHSCTETQQLHSVEVGRNYMGIELNKEYVKLAEERLGGRL